MTSLDSLQKDVGKAERFYDRQVIYANEAASKLISDVEYHIDQFGHVGQIEWFLGRIPQLPPAIQTELKISYLKMMIRFSCACATAPHRFLCQTTGSLPQHRFVPRLITAPSRIKSPFTATTIQTTNCLLMMPERHWSLR